MLQKNGHIPSDPSLFKAYAEYGHFVDVRVSALEALVDYTRGRKCYRPHWFHTVVDVDLKMLICFFCISSVTLLVTTCYHQLFLHHSSEIQAHIDMMSSHSCCTSVVSVIPADPTSALFGWDLVIVETTAIQSTHTVSHIKNIWSW